MSHWLLLFATLLGVGTSTFTKDILQFPSAASVDASVPIPPRQDPFYTAPEGFETAQPGTVLRIRQAPGNLTSIFNASSTAYNILFRTTDSRYQPAWAVTTLLIPETASKSDNDTSTLVSYQIPYNTVNLDQSVSYLLYTSYAAPPFFTEIQALLTRGWLVNVPDFEGPTTSFLSGVLEGHAVIDSVRAALTFAPGAQTALWGYSGGSLASGWAAELAVQYAPELQIAGVVLGGLAPNATELFYTLNGEPAALIIPAAILGLTNQYPEATDYVKSSLNSDGLYNATGFLATQNLSITEAAAFYGSQDVLNLYFRNGNATILDSPLLRKIFIRDGLLGFHGVPSSPLFVYKAVKDEFTHIEYTDALVDRYCTGGANVTYRRNSIGNHNDEFLNGSPLVLAWLDQVLGAGTSGSGGAPVYANASAPVRYLDCDIQNATYGTQDHPPFYIPPQ